MHIQQVQIKNFRCFEDLTVNLNPDVNIFVGNNGSGKSAVLDAIAAAMYPYVNGLQRAAEKTYQGYPEKKFQEPVQIFQRDLPIKYRNYEHIAQSEFAVLAKDLPSWKISYNKTSARNENQKLSIKTSKPFSSELQRLEGSEDLFLDIENRYMKSINETSLVSILSYYKNNRNLGNITYKKLGIYDLYNFSRKLGDS